MNSFEKKEIEAELKLLDQDVKEAEKTQDLMELKVILRTITELKRDLPRGDRTRLRAYVRAIVRIERLIDSVNERLEERKSFIKEMKPHIKKLERFSTMIKYRKAAVERWQERVEELLADGIEDERTTKTLNSFKSLLWHKIDFFERRGF